MVKIENPDYTNTGIEEFRSEIIYVSDSLEEGSATTLANYLLGDGNSWDVVKSKQRPIKCIITVARLRD